MASRLNSVFLATLAEPPLCVRHLWEALPRKCEEPLEALAVTNQGNSKFLAMHAELVSAMHASGVTAVAHIKHDRGPAHGRAVWLPWQIVSKGDRNCFASIFWAPYHQTARYTSNSKRRRQYQLLIRFLICGMLGTNDTVGPHFPSRIKARN